MARRLISSGSTFEADMGYSRAVVDGEWVFVSGTTGFDYRTMTLAEGVVAQAEQCFRNIEAALAEAGSGFADVVRVTYVLPDASEFAACWPVMRKYFGTVRPGGDDDLGRAGRPAHEDRDRGHRPQARRLTKAWPPSRDRTCCARSAAAPMPACRRRAVASTSRAGARPRPSAPPSSRACPSRCAAWRAYAPPAPRPTADRAPRPASARLVARDRQCKRAASARSSSTPSFAAAAATPNRPRSSSPATKASTSRPRTRRCCRSCRPHRRR